MKLLRLLSDFLTGATAVTLMGWVLSLTPYFLRIGVYSVVLALLAIVLAFALDDPISEYFQIELSNYYAIVTGVAIAFLSGLAVLGGLLWL
jgi:hypothetical protein